MQTEIILPQPHQEQQKVLSSAARFKVLMCGRRWGKSLISQSTAIEGGLAGECIAYITPTYQLAKTFFDDILKLLPAEVYDANKADLTIKFITGGLVQFFTGERLDALRGRKFHKVIIDEGAYISGLMEGWNNAIRPTLTDYQGGALFLSTPKGKNDFYAFSLKGLNGEAHWETFKFTTYGNPHIPKSEIDDAKSQLPELVFKQEYLADPAENADNPFGGPFIKRCISPLSTAPPVCFGIDLAKSVDWTVIVGLDAAGFVCYFDRFQKDWHGTKHAIRLLPRKPIAADSTGVGDPIVEELQNEGLDIEGVKYTSTSKQQLMLGLVSGIQQQKVGFPEGPITEELGVFEYQYTANGVRYSAPQGFHDDCVNALALAWQCYTQRRATGRYNIY